MKLVKTAERVGKEAVEDNYVYQRLLFGYAEASRLISGKVLEVGTGTGYGLDLLAQEVDEMITLDKDIDAMVNVSKHNNIFFIKMKVPPFKGIPDNSMDFVISFHVIEHILNDSKFIEEAYRVLKPGGKVILSTPNKVQSITRNPWHVREYSPDELIDKVRERFNSLEAKGIFQRNKASDYFESNRTAVSKIMKYDFLNLQYRLPRFLLKVPYDVFNRLNRKKMLSSDSTLVKAISQDDFYLNPVNDDCIDLFYVAQKTM